MGKVLDLMRERIARGECPVCGMPVMQDFKVVLDNAVTMGEIKICKKHETYNNEGGTNG
jgi:hypothetical protein